MRKALITSLLLTTVFSSGCERNSEEKKTLPPRPIYSMIIPQPIGERQRTFSGQSIPIKETRLSFRVMGEVIDVNVKKGEVVKAGDTVARLDPTDYQLQAGKLQTAKTDLSAHLIRVRDDYKRAEKLVAAGSMAQKKLDEARASYDSTKAQFEGVEIALELAQRQIDYCTLKTNHAGYVSSIMVETHETVSAGDPIVLIASLEDIHMQIGIPEKFISQIVLGKQASVVFDILPDVTFPAVVEEMGVTTTATTTYLVSLKLTKPDDRIRAGMVGETTLTFQEENSNDISVPPAAVVGGPGGQTWVWIVDPKTDRATKRFVKVGTLGPTGLLIKSGVKPGEKLVTKGVHSLKEGQPVRDLTAIKPNFK